jgi:hypothetical protein
VRITAPRFYDSTRFNYQKWLYNHRLLFGNRHCFQGSWWYVCCCFCRIIGAIFLPAHDRFIVICIIYQVI